MTSTRRRKLRLAPGARRSARKSRTTRSGALGAEETEQRHTHKKLRSRTAALYFWSLQCKHSKQ